MKRRDKIPFSVPSKRKPKPAVVIGIVSLAVAILCIAGLQLAHALLPGAEFSISKAQTSTSEPIEDTASDTPIVEKTIFVHVEGAVAAPGCSSFPRVRGCTTLSKRLEASLKTRGMTR